MWPQMHFSPWSNTLVLAFHGALDLTATPVLSSAADIARDSGCDCILDLADVDSVYDSGVSVLMLFRDRLGDQASIRVVNCPQHVKARLELLGLDERLDVA